MYQLLSYLKFLIGSTNQHGVHSPFVYNFLTKGLYREKKKGMSVKEHVLTTSISYFKYKSIAFVYADDYIINRIVAIFGDLEFDTLPLDVIFVEENGKVFTSISKESYHNDTMLLISGIYKNKQRKVAWQNIKELPEVTVTIDLFHCGLVFFRREQAKEHFKVRI
ncbi:hypothetical protein DZC72_17330 [Maribacter algicola]|uniref:Uncharacterized protein n=1 Tax=Maribacter algicola TaxID=2498892 RepID=A0A426RF06_9FLAO|nr:hypothetical protein [Maribacter algicola]RRQ47499.1 hypothetical protein DZC72_17330 [Maribacter algicola]